MENNLLSQITKKIKLIQISEEEICKYSKLLKFHRRKINRSHHQIKDCQNQLNNPIFKIISNINNDDTNNILISSSFANLLPLILGYLPIFCERHNIEVYSDCVLCLKTEKYSRSLKWQTLGPINYMHHVKLCPYIDIIPTNKIDLEVLKNWYTYSEYFAYDCMSLG